MNCPHVLLFCQIIFIFLFSLLPVNVCLLFLHYRRQSSEVHRRTLYVECPTPHLVVLSLCINFLPGKIPLRPPASPFSKISVVIYWYHRRLILWGWIWSSTYQELMQSSLRVDGMKFSSVHYCVCAATIVRSMGTKSMNIEKILSGTRSDDSVTLRLSSLWVFALKCIALFFRYVFFIYRKKFDLANICISVGERKSVSVMHEIM